MLRVRPGRGGSDTATGSPLSGSRPEFVILFFERQRQLPREHFPENRNIGRPAFRSPESPRVKRPLNVIASARVIDEDFLEVHAPSRRFPAAAEIDGADDIDL